MKRKPYIVFTATTLFCIPMAFAMDSDSLECNSDIEYGFTYIGKRRSSTPPTPLSTLSQSQRQTTPPQSSPSTPQHAQKQATPSPSPRCTSKKHSPVLLLTYVPQDASQKQATQPPSAPQNPLASAIVIATLPPLQRQITPPPSPQKMNPSLPTQETASKTSIDQPMNHIIEIITFPSDTDDSFNDTDYTESRSRASSPKRLAILSSAAIQSDSNALPVFTPESTSRATLSVKERMMRYCTTFCCCSLTKNDRNKE